MGDDLKPKVLIVGAGPTGLTAAVELARKGIIADVVEKLVAPSQLSRAVGILPRSMDILKPSGVANKIKNTAIVIEHAVFHHGKDKIATLNLDQSADPNQRLLSLAQDKTQTYLTQVFEHYGGQVEYSNPLSNVEQSIGSVTATLNSGKRNYDYIIAADGVASRVREILELDYAGFDIPKKWSIADIECNEWRANRDFKVYFLKSGEVVIVVPLQETRFRVISNTPDALASLPIATPISQIYRQASFTISVRQVSRYQVGRIFLAGDAAHCHSPVGGRGMNLGIADAAELANRFISGDLDGYHASRHRDGRHTIALSERGRKLVCSPSSLKRRLLISSLWTISRYKPLHDRMVSTLLSN